MTHNVTNNIKSTTMNFLKLTHSLGTLILALSPRPTQVIPIHFNAACKHKQKQFATCNENYSKQNMH